MGTTIYDIAREAGVSIATVSKVINGTGRISEKTTKRVQEVMARLNYQPSTIASALTSKRTFTIGVIVPNIANPFFGEVARIIEKYAYEAGYVTMVCSTYNDFEREAHNIQLFLRQQVDGLLIATEQISSEQLLQFNIRRVPIVKLSAFSDRADIFSVSTDNYRGGQMAAQYIYEQGHRHVWLMGEQGRYSEQQRLAGFRHFFHKKGVPIAETAIYHVDTEYEKAMEVAMSVLKQQSLPSAIFVTTDIVASVLLKAANELGVKVPNDVSIIGFDNTISSQLSYPPLTTIAQPIQEIGQAAVRHMIAEIEGTVQPPFQPKYLLPVLIERQSVKRWEA